MHDIAISTDGTLVAVQKSSREEVHVQQYSRNGQRIGKRCSVTRKSFKEDPMFITRTKNGNIVAGTQNTKLFVLSSDLTLMQSMSVPLGDYSCTTNCKCSPIDDTLAVKSGGQIVLLPPEAYLPPFSLVSLCISAVLQHSDVLLVTFLPPGLQRLMKSYIQDQL